MTCHCGEPDCLYFGLDYPWCRPCEEHHRAPECAINESGQSLCWDGRTWDEIEEENRRSE